MLNKGLVTKYRLHAEANASEAIRMIHCYSIEQVELWKQVPSWALEADGRTGYDGLYQKAYTEKLWMLGNGPLFVDLETGKFVKVICGIRYELSVEDNKTILSLAFELDQLDADKILFELKEKSKITDGFSNATSEERREELRKELKLDPVAI